MFECSVAANNATDPKQLGTIQIPDGPWVDQLPKAWRSHMNTQLGAQGLKDRLRMRAAGKAGLWAAAAPKTVPLDQGSVNGVMHNVHDGAVREQVCTSLSIAHMFLAYSWHGLLIH